jgi:recombination protein RecR
VDSINKLISLFSDFPTVGPRTAGRFVFYLLKQPKEKIEELANAILDLKNKTKFCSFCFNPHETSENLCPVCLGYNRNKNLLCIVEKEADLISIENTKKYNGLYFILGGNAGTMRKQDIENLRIEELKKRVLENKFEEIIIAINPTPEGITASGLVERAIKEIPNQSFKITHLAKGIPVGGELEYADEETLESAFEGRK